MNPAPIQIQHSCAESFKKHPIRIKEDALFEEWVESRPNRYPFATDGCADPAAFEAAPIRIVYVLKERNWGHTVDEQRSLAGQNLDLATRLASLREDDCRGTFNSWWAPMAQWTDAILSTAPLSWPAIQDQYRHLPNSAIGKDKSGSSDKTNPQRYDDWITERNLASLGRCACVQLKKSPGGGTMNHGDFATIVTEDREFILRQFAIYSPHFIISCGSTDNWSAFRQILFPGVDIRTTRNGINFLIASSQDHGLRQTAVVNFGHPSMRVNSSLWGALAFGLRDALEEIRKTSHGLGG